MKSTEAQYALENIAIALRDLDGVTFHDGDLQVGGSAFAFLNESALVVRLPSARRADLIRRGFGTPFTEEGRLGKNWLRLADMTLWGEVAEEACNFAMAPAVGGES